MPMKNSTRISVIIVLLLLTITSITDAQVAPQLPLNPKSIPQFVDPLPHFAGLRVNAKAGGNLTIRMVKYDQIALSTRTVVNGGIIGGVINPAINPSQGKAHLWVYQISKDGGLTFTPPNWPAFTIEAQKGNALNVTYDNQLVGETYDKVGLIVDQTLHWADPLMLMDPLNINPYLDEIPAVVHLHGGEVPPLSDGGPDSWFTPGNVKRGHAFNPEPYTYPNTQEAATLWYHDHALGVTRLNVYAGMAGFYFLRGADEENAHLPGWSGDDLVKEVAPIGASGTFNPYPYLPEIEIAIQDRMFDTNGQLYFPNLPTNPGIHPFWTPEFVGDIITVNGKTWPYLSVAPRKYRFRILNGSNARTYELWLQNLATGTFGPVIKQVGTDGGLLDAPVVINPALGQKLILMPGERADVVIDFSTSPAGTVWTVRNSGRTPYPNGGPPNGSTLGRIMQFVVNGLKVDGPDANTDVIDYSQVPASLRGTPLVKLTNFAGAPATGVTVAKTRQLTLNEVMGMGGPLEILVNNTKWSGRSVDTEHFTDGVRPGFTPVGSGMHASFYSEIIDEGTTEVWKIINLTADAHPIHLHLVQLQLISRQNFNVNNYNKAYNALFPATTTVLDPMTGLPYPGGVFIGGYGPPKAYDFYYNNGAGWLGGNPDVTPYLQGPVKPANPNEKGWKDTFTMYPGQVTTVIARWAPTDKAVTEPYTNLYFGFDPNGGHGYVWHCHIIDHEDNEMMRPYMVVTNKNNPNKTIQSAPRSLNVAYAKAGNALSSNAVAVAENLSESIDKVVLGQNYPNPFSRETEIQFSLPESGHVSLVLYNSTGVKIKTLIDAGAPAGVNTVRLDAGSLTEGVYFYQLRVGFISIVKRMVVQK